MIAPGARRLPIVPALATVLVLLVLASAAIAKEAANAAKVESFFLENGLQVVVIPDHRAPVVTHMIWYKVGSADEPPGKSGIAHFFEHLMFKGTSNHRAGVFSRAVAEIGGEENAFTSDDYTAFYQKVSPGALGTMMAFEADRMHNLVLTDDVIGPERDVIIEERSSRIDNDPQSLLSEEFDATLYQNHPYRIPVIGWMREIKQLNRKDAVDFYTRYYAPNNAILVVAGDVTAERVRKLAEDTYGKVPRGPDLPPRKRPQEPVQNTSRTVTMADPRVTVPSMQMAWVVPSYHTAAPGEAEALDLLAEILGGGTRSRIYQELIVKAGIASSAGAWYQGTSYDDTRFTVYGSPRGQASLSQVEGAIRKQITRIAADGVTADELEKAKNRFVKSVIFDRDSQSSMARIYGSTLASGGTIEDIEEWPERVRAVKADAVRDAARKYLTFDHVVTGYLLPKARENGEAVR